MKIARWLLLISLSLVVVSCAPGAPVEPAAETVAQVETEATLPPATEQPKQEPTLISARATATATAEIAEPAIGATPPHENEAPDEEAIVETEAPTVPIGEAGMVTYQTLELSDGALLDYAVVLPKGFDSAQTYPILLTMPPGPQTRTMVQVGLDGYWAEQAIERGWVVLSPAAPEGVLFFQGSEILIPEFLERTATVYRPEGGKYHLGGISNGGISAFRLAVDNPELFHSVLVLPGLPRNETDFQGLALLKDIPVAMFVGEQDSGWVERMQATEAELSRLGGQVSLEIIPNEGHVIQSLTGGEALFDLLESFR